MFNNSPILRWPPPLVQLQAERSELKRRRRAAAKREKRPSEALTATLEHIRPGEHPSFSPQQSLRQKRGGAKPRQTQSRKQIHAGFQKKQVVTFAFNACIFAKLTRQPGSEGPKVDVGTRLSGRRSGSSLVSTRISERKGAQRVCSHFGTNSSGGRNG